MEVAGNGRRKGIDIFVRFYSLVYLQAHLLDRRFKAPLAQKPHKPLVIGPKPPQPRAHTKPTHAQAQLNLIQN